MGFGQSGVPARRLLLAAEGIEVTQATLSRDLEELGAVKLRGATAAPASTWCPRTALLAAEGIEVTQATLSRDLEELGAVKLRGATAAPAWAI